MLSGFVEEVEGDEVVVMVWYGKTEDWESSPEQKMFVGDESSIISLAWRPYQAVQAFIIGSYPEKFYLVEFNSSQYFKWLSGNEDSFEARADWAYSKLAEPQKNRSA